MPATRGTSPAWQGLCSQEHGGPTLRPTRRISRYSKMWDPAVHSHSQTLGKPSCRGREWGGGGGGGGTWGTFGGSQAFCVLTDWDAGLMTAANSVTGTFEIGTLNGI